MEKQADGIEPLKLLYHDEQHFYLPRDTLHESMRIIMDDLDSSHRALTEGAEKIRAMIMDRIQ